jgi:hypothetical protein
MMDDMDDLADEANPHTMHSTPRERIVEHVSLATLYGDFGNSG